MAEERKTEFKNKIEESLPVVPKKKYKSGAQKKKEQELKKPKRVPRMTQHKIYLHMSNVLWFFGS